MYQTVWSELIGLARLGELEAFIKTRREPAPTQPRPDRHAGFDAAQFKYELSEGVPVPREPASLVERSQDGEARAAPSDAKGRMPVANVRRRGTGSPEPCGELAAARIAHKSAAS
jgi:hypothetical protein